MMDGIPEITPQLIAQMRQKRREERKIEDAKPNKAGQPFGASVYNRFLIPGRGYDYQAMEDAGLDVE